MRVHGWCRMLSATVVAAVLSAVTLPAGAQVTSEQRIPVKKESGGDVARKDSIARADAARRDSIAMLQAQNDSLMRANQAYRDSVNRAIAAYRDSVANAVPVVHYDSVAAADSVRMAAAAAAAATAAIPVALSRRGFYFGLAGGTSSPTNDWATPYSLGFNITAPFGWQSYENRFGIRGDIAYDLHGGEYLPAGTVNQPVNYPEQHSTTTSNVLVQDLAIWSGNLDATFDILQWGDRRLGAFYVLGGVGIHYFSTRKADILTATNQPSSTVENESSTEFGWNAGAGVSFGIGTSSLFLESRWFTADLSPTNATWAPLILGIKFF